MSYAIDSQRALHLTAAAALCLALTGCGLGTATSALPVAGAKFTGNVHGGQQPIAGAALQLYTAGSTGYGSSGTTLLTGSVTTDAQGNFILPAYTCPTAATPVYLVATGGNPGLGTGVNSGIAAMAALGACGSLTGSTYISMNEVTTVASVWALAPFMSGIGKIGTPATNAQGLVNAFNAVNKVANIGSGQVSGPALPAGAVLPVSKINTLADILAACINTAGGTAGDGSPCGMLYAATTVGGVAPTNTISAALNIAQHPNANVGTLTGLVAAAAPFQPTLGATPNDLSILISYSAGALSTPRAVATDGTGNVWIANSGANTVTELDNTGAVLSGAAGYAVGTGPAAIAVDTTGNAWVANKTGNTVSKVSPGGTVTAYTGGSLSTPSSVALDAYGSVWVANSGSASMTKIASNGILTNYTSTGVTAPVGIAINPK